MFITTRVFLEGTPVMGTYGFHYCLGVLGGDTYDGYIVHRFHELRVIRESKARTTLLQSIPDDHVADFHYYMDDARDIWNVQSKLAIAILLFVITTKLAKKSVICRIVQAILHLPTLLHQTQKDWSHRSGKPVLQGDAGDYLLSWVSLSDEHNCPFEVEGRPLFNRFAKANNMKVVPPPLSGDYTPLSDHIDLDES
ncbi:hypothetical protein Tco_1418723 [Tanacetum coccineum]